MWPVLLLAFGSLRLVGRGLMRRLRLMLTRRMLVHAWCWWTRGRVVLRRRLTRRIVSLVRLLLRLRTWRRSYVLRSCGLRNFLRVLNRLVNVIVIGPRYILRSPRLLLRVTVLRWTRHVRRGPLRLTVLRRSRHRLTVGCRILCWRGPVCCWQAGPHSFASV